KVRNHRAGYEVVTPLRLGEGIHILVNRGWIEAPARREQLPAVVTPRGPVRVEGIVLTHLPRALKLGDPGKGRVRQSLELKAFALETGLPLQAFVIEQHRGIADGLLREWPRPDTGIEKHEAYSFQWYSLAALAVVLGIVFSFRKRAPASKYGVVDRAGVRRAAGARHGRVSAGLESRRARELRRADSPPRHRAPERAARQMGARHVRPRGVRRLLRAQAVHRAAGPPRARQGHGAHRAPVGGYGCGQAASRHPRRDRRHPRGEVCSGWLPRPDRR